MFYGTELQSRLDITFSISPHRVQTHALIFRITRHSLTHKETSTLPMKGFTLWPILGIHGHWAVRVLERETLSVTGNFRLYWSSPMIRDTRTCCWAFGSWAVTTWLNDLQWVRRDRGSNTELPHAIGVRWLYWILYYGWLWLSLGQLPLKLILFRSTCSDLIENIWYTY